VTLFIPLAYHHTLRRMLLPEVYSKPAGYCSKLQISSRKYRDYSFKIPLSSSTQSFLFHVYWCSVPFFLASCYAGCLNFVTVKPNK